MTPPSPAATPSPHWLVLGGTGFVGRALAEQLHRRAPPGGPRLLVPTRRPTRSNPLATLPRVDLVQADVHDDAELRQLLAGAAVVVNLVGVLHGDEARFEQVHAALPRRVGTLARAAGARVVHVSALGAAADAPSMYLRSKARGEQALRDSGAAVTVLRPSVVFGRCDRLLNLFADLQRWLPVLPLAGADARLQPVWVGDLAEAIARCIERPETIGQTYEIAGPEAMTLAALVHAAGRHAGCPRRIVALPAPLARLQAAAMRLLPGEPLISRDNLDSLKVPSVATPGAPGLAALGIVPTPLDPVAAAILGHGEGCGRLDAARARHRA